MARATVTDESRERTRFVLAGGSMSLLTTGLLLSGTDAAAADNFTLSSSANAVSAGTLAADSNGHGVPSGGGEFLPIAAVFGGAIIVGGALVIVLRVAGVRRRRDKAAAVAASRGKPRADVPQPTIEGRNDEVPD
jgi:hypothetical protein